MKFLDEGHFSRAYEDNGKVITVCKRGIEPAKRFWCSIQNRVPDKIKSFLPEISFIGQDLFGCDVFVMPKYVVADEKSLTEEYYRDLIDILDTFIMPLADEYIKNTKMCAFIDPQFRNIGIREDGTFVLFDCVSIYEDD